MIYPRLTPNMVANRLGARSNQTLPISSSHWLAVVDNADTGPQLPAISGDNISIFANNKVASQVCDFLTDRIRGSCRFIRNRPGQDNFVSTANCSIIVTN
jgi:hypothetical protein